MLKVSKKGQIAIEYMIIIGLIMLISIPTLLIYQNHSNSITRQVKLNQAKIALQNIIDVAQNVYYSGEFSKEIIKIYFPESINQIFITNYEIYALVDGMKVYSFSDILLNGSLKPYSGVHHIIIESKNNGTNYIQITEK